MATPKHIAMWCYPRSRSTVMARAFEQLDECFVIDEPFSGVYSTKVGLTELLASKKAEQPSENDAKKVIATITGDLPAGKSFSFQKHMAKHLISGISQDFLKHLTHFFLIRSPVDAIASHHKEICLCEDSDDYMLTTDIIGIEAQFHLFKKVKQLMGIPPLVISSDDLVQAPDKYLPYLCDYLEINYSDKMLQWQKNPKLQSSNLRYIDGRIYSSWYKNVSESTGFINESKSTALPDDLIPLAEKCMPFYEELLQYRAVVD